MTDQRPDTPPLPPSAPDNLPLTLMTLTDWELVQVSGPDAYRYLQGQVTYDMNELTPDQHILCAHCDAKGKVWSSLRLFCHGEDLAYLQRASLSETQVSELKKYAVFSKITIARQPQVVLLGVAGSEARTVLDRYYSRLPDIQQPVIQHTESHSTLLYFHQPIERFLLIVTPQQAEFIRHQLLDIAEYRDSQQWLAMDIAAGIPILDQLSSDQFIPQALNLQALAAISFTKGCYAGQEMVARAKYRGANKRAMYWLSGQADRMPDVGEDLELGMGNNWRRTGTILARCRLADGTLWVQAVLSNDLAPDSLLRVRGDQPSTLHIQPLPYSL